MTRRVDNVDFNILIKYSRVFGQNGNAALPLNVIGIHDALLHRLIFPKNAGLLQKLVDQRCFSVINVGNNCYISNIFSFLNHCVPSFFPYARVAFCAWRSPLYLKRHR